MLKVSLADGYLDGLRDMQLVAVQLRLLEEAMKRKTKMFPEPAKPLLC